MLSGSRTFSFAVNPRRYIDFQSVCPAGLEPADGNERIACPLGAQAKSLCSTLVPKLQFANAASPETLFRIPQESSRKREFLIDRGLVRHDCNLARHIRNIGKGIAPPWRLPARGLADHSLFLPFLGIIEELRPELDRP